jgi:hypothetical protein
MAVNPVLMSLRTKVEKEDAIRGELRPLHNPAADDA